MTIGQFIIGVLITAFGVWMAWKTGAVLQLLGRNYWAEKTFGGGGSRLLYKLIGIAFSILGIIVMTDLYDIIVGGFIMSVFSGGAL